MMDLTRVLITGADGMIGSAIPWGIKTDRTTLDVTHPEQIKDAIATHRPAAILHLAALDIHASAERPFDAYRVNVFGTAHCVTLAVKYSLPFVFLSSGAVFNGQPKQIHDEDAAPDPINIFAQTKVLSEIIIRSHLPNALIIRTGWVFGGHQAYHRKFVDTAIERAKKDEPINAANDQWGSPTGITDLTTTIGSLIGESRTGLFHVVNGGAATAFDMAQEIVAALGSRSPVRSISARTTVKPGLERPASEALTSRFMTLRPWQDALRAYVRARASPSVS